VTQLLRMPPRGRSGGWLIALGIALALSVQPIWPDRTAIGVTGAIAIMFLAATRWRLTWSPVVVLVLCSISLRWSSQGQIGSDVTDVTRAALQHVFAGLNPYGIGYLESRPSGAPFPYGPIDLLWTAPFARSPIALEGIVSIAITLYLGLRAAHGRPVGLAVYAVAPPLVITTINGSNDTSAGLFILLAIVAAARKPVLGAALLAVAVAYKPYAIAYAPPLLLWAGLPAAIAFVGASVVAWSPVLFEWGLGSYLRSLSMAQATHLRQPYWSFGAIIDQLVPDFVARWMETLRYALGGLIAAIGAMRIRSIDGVIAVGTIAFLVLQFGGYFGSFVYLGAVAPILCWQVDDWLRKALPDIARAYGALPASPSRRASERRRQPAPVPVMVSGSVAPARDVVHVPVRLTRVMETPRADARATRAPSV